MKKSVLAILATIFLLLASTTMVWGAVQGDAELEQQMLELVNKERAKEGLAPLTMNNQLVQLARMKSQDMIDKNYFSHTSPTYGDPFTMLKNYGVQYRMAGENLAGNPSLTGGHQSLMESPGHRANILKAEFNQVGIGVVRGGPYGLMITQMFIKARTETTTNPQVQPIEKTTPQKKEPVINSDLKIYHNNQEIVFPDSKPYINKDNRIMVPIRFVSEEMDSQVQWENISQKITIKNARDMINLWIGKKNIQKNNQIYINDTAPELVNNRTMVPLRMVSEILGSKVIWYPELNKVEIL